MLLLITRVEFIQVTSKLDMHWGLDLHMFISIYSFFTNMFLNR